MLGWATDYRRFGDLLIATRWTHRVGGQSWSATYESFEVNRVDPSVFELPATIRALLEPGS